MRFGKRPNEVKDHQFWISIKNDQPKTTCCHRAFLFSLGGFNGGVPPVFLCFSISRKLPFCAARAFTYRLVGMGLCWSDHPNLYNFYCFCGKGEVISAYISVYQHLHPGDARYLSIQGYALFSIVFSTLFLIASYWFSLKNVSSVFKDRFSWKLIKASLFYLVFSSLGPWAVGGIVAPLGKGSIWYKLAIYFYLHFQYNVWFILALWGILFYIFEEAGLKFSAKKTLCFFYLLNGGIRPIAFHALGKTSPTLLPSGRPGGGFCSAIQNAQKSGGIGIKTIFGHYGFSFKNCRAGNARQAGNATRYRSALFCRFGLEGSRFCDRLPSLDVFGDHKPFIICLSKTF